MSCNLRKRELSGKEQQKVQGNTDPPFPYDMLDGEGYTEEDLVNHGTQIKCLISRHANTFVVQYFSCFSKNCQKNATNYLLPPRIT
jgi:hypothetical protein